MVYQGRRLVMGTICWMKDVSPVRASRPRQS
jgi:hypothetical protein